ncbi:MAG: hypothetical protein ACI87C_001112 [Paraperlucidibaca sp.]|jgi:hypothetical protein
MAAFQQAAKRRRLSLSMMVMLLLHWSFSSCAALADTLCVEPDGVVVWWCGSSLEILVIQLS